MGETCPFLLYAKKYMRWTSAGSLCILIFRSNSGIWWGDFECSVVRSPMESFGFGMASRRGETVLRGPACEPGFGWCHVCEMIQSPCWYGWGGREVKEGHAHVLGGETQGHLCGQKIVRSWNWFLMNSLHAVEMAGIIIAYFVCLWRVPANWV